MRTNEHVATAVAVAALTAGTAHAEWKAPAVISATPEDSSSASLAIGLDGTLHAVWHDGSIFDDAEVFHSSRPPGGPWSPPENVSRRPGSPSHHPEVALTLDGTVHVVWDDGPISQRDVYYSARRGDGWSTALDLSSSDESSTFPTIVTGGSLSVYVVWEEGSTLYFTEQPPGGTFGPPVDVAGSLEDVGQPQLLVDDGHLYLGWYEWDGSDYDFRFSERIDGGSWTSPTIVQDTDDGSVDVRLALDDAATLHAVWREGPAFGRGDIAYSRRPAGGTWEPWVHVSETPGDSDDPHLLIEDDGTVHVAWHDGTPGQSDILHSARPPGGPWSLPENVSDTPLTSQDVAAELRLVDGAVTLYWVGFQVTGTIGAQLYESVLSPLGWGPPRPLSTRLLTTSVEGVPPQIGPDGTAHWIFSGRFDELAPDDVWHLRNDGPQPTAPSGVSFEPDGGAGVVGTATTLRTTYLDANGGASLRRAFLLLNDGSRPAGGALVVYDWTAGALGLFDPSGSGIADVCELGKVKTLTHEFFSLDCLSSTVELLGEDEMALDWSLTFTDCPPSGCGELDATLLAIDADGLVGSPTTVGSWTLDP